MALLAIYRVSCPHSIFTHTTQSGPRRDGERLWPGLGSKPRGRTEPSRTSRPYTGLDCPKKGLNGKGREASLTIASSQSPAVQPGNGCTTRVRDPSNSAPANQIGSGSRNTHRPLDTRRYRVNKIEGEEEPSRTGITPHRTPRPPWPCPVWG